MQRTSRVKQCSYPPAPLLSLPAGPGRCLRPSLPPAADEREEEGPGGTASLLSEGSGKNRPGTHGRPKGGDDDKTAPQNSPPKKKTTKQTYTPIATTGFKYLLRAQARPPLLPPRPKFPHCEGA